MRLFAILFILFAVSGTALKSNSYEFGRSSFSASMWIKGGELFTDVESVEIEMTDAGAFALEVYDSSNRLVSRGDRPNPRGGWSTFNFRSGMAPLVFSGKFKLKLVNHEAGTRHIKQGIVNCSSCGAE